jgi:hypothetical protein
MITWIREHAVHIWHVSNAVVCPFGRIFHSSRHNPTNPPRTTPRPAVQPLLSSRYYPSHLISSSPHLILSPITAATQHHVGRGRRLSNPTWSSSTCGNSSAPGLPYLELLRSCSVVPTMVASPTTRSSAPPSNEKVGWRGTDASIHISTSRVEPSWAEASGAGTFASLGETRSRWDRKRISTLFQRWLDHARVSSDP